jgi:hypothetical protein
VGEAHTHDHDVSVAPARSDGTAKKATAKKATAKKAGS